MTRRTPARRKRLLVFNFFAGVKDRGIALYAHDIALCARELGVEVVELRCPRWLSRLPDPLLNMLFVLCEQIVAPLLRIVRRCTLTVYPYNSASVIDALCGRSLLIVHDLIPNDRRTGTLSARYIRTSQFVHTWLRRPVCAASASTIARLQRLRRFADCPLHFWPNPFYSFAAAARVARVEPGGRASLRVLLCSGMGANKDYPGAVQLLRESQALAGADVRIIGFGHDAPLARRRIERLPEPLKSRITVLSALSTAEVVAEYAASDLVWVHSAREGFGRSIVEARILGRRVLASDISAFRALAWMQLTLYRTADFDRALHAALAQPESALDEQALHAHHAPLESSMRAVLAHHGGMQLPEPARGNPG